MALSSKITSAIAGLVVLTVAGYSLDVELETQFVFTILGMLVGMAFGGWQLYRLVQSRAFDFGDSPRLANPPDGDSESRS